MKKNVLKKALGLAFVFALSCAFVSCNRDKDATSTSDPVTGGEEDTGTALNAASGWWVNMMESDVKVDSASVVTLKFTVDDVIGTDNWSTPDIYLLTQTAGEDGTLTWTSDVACVRSDNYGWKGTENTGANLESLGWTLESAWDWDNFLSIIEGSEYVVKIYNYGDTVNVCMTITAADGTEYYQNYKNISLSDADNLYVRLSGDAGAWTGTFYGTESASLTN